MIWGDGCLVILGLILALVGRQVGWVRVGRRSLGRGSCSQQQQQQQQQLLRPRVERWTPSRTSSPRDIPASRTNTNTPKLKVSNHLTLAHIPPLEIPLAIPKLDQNPLTSFYCLECQSDISSKSRFLFTFQPSYRFVENSYLSLFAYHVFYLNF